MPSYDALYSFTFGLVKKVSKKRSTEFFNFNFLIVAWTIAKFIN